ncbi:MAG TPA: hypothetical protein VGT04_15340 [Acidobacteriaceae bacterium]|nr:hypothetical protein [Acidobacteriaceae bacterium]
MKKTITCAVAGAFVAAMLMSGSPAKASPTTAATPAPALQPYGAPQEGGYYPNEPWATPPAEYQAVQQKGFHDGVRGAYKDAQNHRPPNVNNRDEYRHPDVPHRDRRAYREAFRHGYWTGVRHLMGYYHGRYPDDDDRR